MTHKQIVPVILSGGMGTRLWPLSRVRQPKQFQPIDGDGSHSFLQETVLRHRAEGFATPMIVASASERELLFDQLADIGTRARFVGEPVGRNTGPAVLAAALILAETDPGALLLVLPSDHIIEGDLNAAVRDMAPAADEGHIVLFGIVPRHPETGFGYISAGASVEGHNALHEVHSFIEKPDLDEATRLVEEGQTFWASGISMMRADVLIDEFARLEPETLAAVKGALGQAEQTDWGPLLAEAPFSEARNEPTERLIFEHSPRVTVRPADVDWSDVGAWPAIHSLGEKTGDGNVETGAVVTLDTHDSLIRAGEKLVAVVGMEGVIVVDTPDALLVTNHENAQMVKEAVSELKRNHRAEVFTHASLPPRAASAHVREETLAKGDDMVVSASDENGVVLTIAGGEGQVTNGSGPKRQCTGDHLAVEPGHTARVHNACETPLTVVAVDLAGDLKGQDGGATYSLQKGRHAVA
ncbi:sugar phosphate nucleotidyltransferase [Maritimibacter sp. UBA3975]|uniref:mannose-1-phosphate guanylyltransferase n=1 Tax=Maritimibacter sp. UBA3975 TaxID=1946833 RepID=UPI0025B7F114|nr:sugar phosphate nucleotidyltransferase [Maritimibacter sp. UBA3975]